MTDIQGDRAARRAGGVFYTPPEWARFLAHQTVARVWTDDVLRAGRALRILDPACGDGVFLHAAFTELAQRYHAAVRDDPGWRFPGQEGPHAVRDEFGRRQLSPELRLWILRQHLFGLDVDAGAVARAIDSLVRRVIPRSTAEDDAGASSAVRRLLADNVRHGNALIGSLPRRQPIATHPPPTLPIPSFDWQLEFPQVFREPNAGFDLVIGNPPYVNARLLTRTTGAEVKQYLRRQYDCAVGGFDLYVLFLERAYDLLRKGGVCGMIVPNKVATADYARPCRRLLLHHTRLEQIIDLASADAFPGTGVYPYILVWTRQPAPPAHEVTIRELVAVPDPLDGDPDSSAPASSDPASSAPDSSDPDSSDRSASEPGHGEPLAGHRGRGGSTRQVLQATLNAEAGFQLHASLDVESRCVCQPLEAVADLYSGTTGFTASALAQRLRERSPTPGGQVAEGFDFIVSGNIDRYVIRAGNVRFMGRRFQRPYLPSPDPILSQAKRQLFATAKIVVAGLTRRIEAAWDSGGLALGVQVYAVLPRFDDAHYLLALLNSKLLTYLFRIRFPAKRLSGGYHSMNKGQLGRLPIRRIDHCQHAQRAAHDRLVTLARRLEQQVIPPGKDDDAADRARVKRALERDLDQEVYSLYGVGPSERRLIEAYFADYFADKPQSL